MAVYEGVLETISGGTVISTQGTGGYLTHNMGITRFHETGVDRQRGFTQRQFVDIGGTRILNVMLWPYHDELLQEAMGQEVALSIDGPPATSGKRHTVIAIRTPKGGINRPTRRQLLVPAIFMTIRFWFVAPFLALFVLIPFIIAGGIAYAVTSTKIITYAIAGVGAAVAGGLLVWWIIRPFVYMRRTLRCASALSEGPGAGVPISEMPVG